MGYPLNQGVTMPVLINKILINLTEVLAITFKNPNTVCIADINKIY